METRLQVQGSSCVEPAAKPRVQLKEISDRVGIKRHQFLTYTCSYDYIPGIVFILWDDYRYFSFRNT